jgi:hypothetical protein
LKKNQLGSKVQNITILKDKRIPVSRNKLLQQWQNAAPSSPVVSGVRVYEVSAVKT